MLNYRNEDSYSLELKLQATIMQYQISDYKYPEKLENWVKGERLHYLNNKKHYTAVRPPEVMAFRHGP